MARILLSGEHMQVNLSARERKLLGRPNFSIDPSRITSVELVAGVELPELGTRVSRRSIFGGVLGEYRAGSGKIMVLGKARALRHLIITLKHPTIDQIIYCGNDADSIYQNLTSA
jgi:hypothetical protein